MSIQAFTTQDNRDPVSFSPIAAFALHPVKICLDGTYSRQHPIRHPTVTVPLAPLVDTAYRLLPKKPSVKGGNGKFL